jgi:hypothetical protein
LDCCSDDNIESTPKGILLTCSSSFDLARMLRVRRAFNNELVLLPPPRLSRSGLAECKVRVFDVVCLFSHLFLPRQHHSTHSTHLTRSPSLVVRTQFSDLSHFHTITSLSLSLFLCVSNSTLPCNLTFFATLSLTRSSVDFYSHSFPTSSTAQFANEHST